MNFLSQLMLVLTVYIILIYNVFLETGIATVLLITAVTIYTLISSTGNTLYAKKLMAISKDLSTAILLIRKRLE